MSELIRWIRALFKRQEYEDCCPHIPCPDEVEEREPRTREEWAEWGKWEP
jgi:hypothetical protein